MPEVKGKDNIESRSLRHAADIVRMIVDAVDNNGELDSAKQQECIESVASSLRGFVKIINPRHHVTCEGCSKRVMAPTDYPLPENWSEFGPSRFKGQTLAAWCQDCIASKTHLAAQGQPHAH